MVEDEGLSPNISIPSSLYSSGYPSALFVYVAIAVRISNEQHASLTSLCEDTHLSKPTVIKARNWLVANDYLLVVTSGTGHAASTYQLIEQSNNFTPGVKDVYPRSKETLPQGLNGFTSLSDTDTDTVTSNYIDTSNYQDTSSKIISLLEGECEGERDWFHPLTTLSGFRSKDYRKTKQTIQEVCEKFHVDPVLVVKEFMLYYPMGRLRHKWRDPVSALTRTLNVQINKVKQQQQRAPPRAAPMTLAEEVAFEKETGVSASSLSADNLKAEWLEKYRSVNHG